MTKKRRHRQIQRILKKYKNLAAIVAGAAILSAAPVPGIHAATVHAAANPDTGKPPITTSQQIEKTDKEKNPIAQQAKAGETSKQSAPAQAPDNAKKVLDIKATAYAPGPHDNDQWGNKTYTGTQIRPGVIAVDPSVIPLGSRVYIEYPDGHGEYAIAEDTGGAIKGNRIDVAKWTVNEAENFGIKNVKVYVLDKGDK